MRGIDEDKAIEIGEQIDSCKYLECSVKEWLRDECQELQEPWLPLEEFLKSGFVGACWVYTDTEFVYTAYYAKDSQFYESDLTEYTAYYAKDSQFYESDLTEYILDRNTIVRVAPIHKPEPPKL